MTKNKPQVSIVMGSDSDLIVMKEAAEILEQFGVPSEIDVVSAHRTPEKLFSFAKNALDRGIKVIIAGAGGAAHLPGMVAALTPLPVIGVPVKNKTMDGIDSFLSIAQMPGGVPVATVAINGGKNAGLLAVEILALSDAKLQNKVIEYKKKMEKDVMVKGKKLSEIGFKKYLEK